MHKDIVKIFRSYPDFKVTRTKRHFRVTNPCTGDFVITATTPSDCRYLRNLQKDLRRLRLGYGYMHLNKSRFHN